MYSLSIVIVNFNTVNILKECLQNLQVVLKDPELKNTQVIVVDNNSTDGSADLVEAEFNWVYLVKAPNKGLAYGQNLGLKVCTNEYILHLGTDAFPSAIVIKYLINQMLKDPLIGIATAKLVLRDGTPDWDAHRGFPTPWAALTHFSKLNKLFPRSVIFNSYFLGHKDINTIHEIDLCISHFLLTTKHVYNKVGLWDDMFFLYGEDVDFCYRVKQAGYKIMYFPAFPVVHYKGVAMGRKQSSDIKTKAQTSLETKFILKKGRTAAMRLFYTKHYKSKYPVLVTSLILAGISLLEYFRTRNVK